ncbi:hypothetical protein [Streptomyces sp. NBC_01314]|uniref:hypothetical protein n=1 Tax=Streptomyces sp. NBC_01314 TaxID=2903821 RepID=UPI0030875307|nr:hypothetical protein OG622_37645 [Streptomyces sp. NBC_01314]
MKEDQLLDSLLGHMIRDAATLEMYLETLVKLLCNSPSGALLISGESSSRVITACRALVDALDDIPQNEKTEFRTLLSQSKQAFERRHPYVHGAIAWNADGKGAVRSRHLKTEAQFELVDLEDLSALGAEFNRLTSTAHERLGKLLPAVYPVASQLPFCSASPKSSSRQSPRTSSTSRARSQQPTTTFQRLATPRTESNSISGTTRSGPCCTSCTGPRPDPPQPTPAPSPRSSVLSL